MLYQFHPVCISCLNHQMRCAKTCVAGFLCLFKGNSLVSVSNICSRYRFAAFDLYTPCFNIRFQSTKMAKPKVYITREVTQEAVNLLEET